MCIIDRRRGKKVKPRSKKLRYERIKAGDDVDPLMILDRDGWKCKSCGIDTPRELRGTTEDNAPEVDHIHPLVLGGEHAEKNLQCLCRKCNRRKGIRLVV